MLYKRKYPIGAELTKAGVHFRIWAPRHRSATLVIENPENKPQEFSLNREKKGYFSLFVPGIKEGTLYRFKLGSSKIKLPDPASHYQPHGVEGPSCIVNPRFPWKDKKWKGITLEGQIIYEMHIGTFTQEGTFKAAMKELPELARLGITLIELMPLNEFPGHFGWGYDGINLFAPFHHYGTPEDLKAFINEAHRLKLGVILDVVYNHFGPEGNFLSHFAKEYFNSKKTTEWGGAINFDHPSAKEFFLTNARYWLHEFHFDGLRVDATTCIFCETEPHVLSELTQVVKKTNPQKKKLVIGENEEQNTQLLKPYKLNGYGFDALWNDDFHHTACVRLLGKKEAYYTDYLGTPQEFISSIKHGYLYQGQYYVWQKKNRGTSFQKHSPSSLVIFLENHDQVANSGQGKRIHQLCDPGNYRAMVCLFLLSPNTPMIFQGQEYGSTVPFFYFADHNKKLNLLVERGRKTFLSQFPRLSSSETKKMLPKPGDWKTFAQCKLDLKQRKENGAHYSLYKDLIDLRKKDPVFKNMNKLRIEGAVINQDAFVIRYFNENLEDRLLIINFGPDYLFSPNPEPLLAPPERTQWQILWSSDSSIYGGDGNPPPLTSVLKIPGHCAIVLKNQA